MNILEEIRKMVYSGEEEKALDLVEKALEQGLGPPGHHGQRPRQGNTGLRCGL